MHHNFLPLTSFKRTAVAMYAVMSLALPALAANNDITRVSVNAIDAQATGSSTSPSLSADGQLVVFSSKASNLANSDSNQKSDIFIKNRSSGAVTKLTDGNNDSTSPVVSQDAGAQFVVFQSTATNLGNIITGGQSHIYLHDRSGPTTTLISKTAGGIQGNGDSAAPVVSDDGQSVAFASTATNLVSPAEIGSFTDVYLYDATNVSFPITRISSTPTTVEPDGSSGSPSISADGRFVAFVSSATNLVVAGDTNGKDDIFLYDKNSGLITLVSHKVGLTESANGTSSAPQVSADGTVVVFQSDATNLVAGTVPKNNGVYLYNISSGLISVIDKNTGGLKCSGDSFSPAVSGDGDVVSFSSDCPDLVNGDSNATDDIFSYDTGSGITTRKSVSVLLRQSLSASSGPSTLNDDGTILAFASDSSELVASDTNLVSDIFITDTNCPTDSDSDSTPDCTDSCPSDANKIAEGTCGCGVADTDSDSDATIDCEDACPSDATKQSEGACGCGISDTDANANGVADCNDPSTSSRPYAPVLSYDRVKRRILVTIPTQYSSVRYRLQLLRDKSVVSQINCPNRRAHFRNLAPGTYTVRYKAGVAAVFSKNSAGQNISVRTGVVGSSPRGSCTN